MKSHARYTPFARTAAALIILVFGSDTVLAQLARARAFLDVQGQVWVGQRVTLVVELLAPGYFAGAPSFELPDPPGILIIPPNESPTVGTEEIDNVTYTVQRHELSVLGRRPGELPIPALTVRFRFKRQPLDKVTVPATVKTQPLTLTLKTPPGAAHLGGIVSAIGLTATEVWQPEPGAAKVGDAFTRTVTFAAPDVPSIAFPDVPTPRVDGLAVYSKAPELDDRTERSARRGERRDSTTFVCQRAGTFVIPATRYSWFDLGARKMRVIEFPSHSLVVSPNPAPVSSGAVTPQRLAITTALLIAATLLAAILVAWGGIKLSRRAGYRWLMPFRPTHLAPLNP